MSRADDEAAQHAAERKAAALHNVGWEVGTGATIWARGVRDTLDLHESARARFTEGTADLEAWERFHATALIVVLAIDQVRAFEERVRSLTGDAELARARSRFDFACPNAATLRHLVAHLDDYAVGTGWRQVGRLTPPISEQNLAPFLSWGDGGGTVVNLGGEHVNLRRAADAAVELAAVVERVRALHLERVEKEANAALLRRFGRPAE